MSIPVTSIYQQYKGLDGQPLENGYIWIGIANQNPETAPVTVYWDSALTQPAVQPLRTVNGYATRSGTPANVFLSSDYSQTVRASDRSLVTTTMSAADAGDYGAELIGQGGSDMVGFIQASTGAVERTAQDKMRDYISVADFGNNTVPGTTDMSTTLDEANTAAAGRALLFQGVLNIVSGVTVTSPIIDTLNQIFTVGSDITIDNGCFVRPEWWGASASASAATNTAAFAAAWEAAAEGMDVLYQNATYNVTALSHLTTKKLNHIGEGATGGTPASGTIIIGSGTPVWDWPYALPGSRDSSMTDIEVRGSTTGQKGLLIRNHGLNLKRVKSSLSLVPIEVQKMYGSTWDEVYAFGSAAEASSISCHFNPTMQGADVGQVDQNTIISLQMSGHATSGTGLKISNGSGGSNGNTFLSPIVTGVDVAYNVVGGLRNTLIGAWSEQINTTHISDNSATAITVWINRVTLGSGAVNINVHSPQIPSVAVQYSPVLSFGGSSTGITYGVQSGWYSVIGNRIFGDIRITLTSKGAQTGAANITLPIAIGDVVGQPSFAIGYANSFDATVATTIFADGTNTTTNLTLYRYAAGAATVLTDAAFTNTSDIKISFNYQF